MYSFEEVNSKRDTVDEFLEFNSILLERMTKNYEKDKLSLKRKAVIFENFEAKLSRKNTISDAISKLITKMNLQ